jgi:hypothetical protein
MSYLLDSLFPFSIPFRDGKEIDSQLTVYRPQSCSAEPT